MQNRLCIGRQGVRAALYALLPKIREAGALAAALQPRIHQYKSPNQKSVDHAAKAALTHADLLLEDRLGSDILMLFEDASFFGEEHEHDRISRFLPNNHPYIITLDPINGTLQYRDGLPHYETIVTICDRTWRIIGAIIYRPAFDEAFIAWNEGSSAQAQRVRWREEATDIQCLDLTQVDMPFALHLDVSWRPFQATLDGAGYEFVDIWSAYAGQADWPYSQADVLLGKCRAMVWRDPWALLIDAGAFGFTVECAGGVWRRGTLDPEKLVYSYTIAAIDSATADFMEQLIT